MRSTMATSAVAASFLLAAGTVGVSPVTAQELRPITVGSSMPDFSLPAYQGGTVTLSELRGKNVLLIFPRGRSGADTWCHVCNYQHMELVDYEATNGLRQRARLEILFVLPYGRDEITEWIEAYPQQLQDLEDWRNPDEASLDEAGRRRMLLARQAFPREFTATPERVPGPFPILIDADRIVSGGLGFFTTEWGGSQADQNIPAVMLIDSQGVLQFKYLSQNTLDRPPLDYLVRMIEFLTAAVRR